MSQQIFNKEHITARRLIVIPILQNSIINDNFIFVYLNEFYMRKWCLLQASELEKTEQLFKLYRMSHKFVHIRMIYLWINAKHNKKKKTTMDILLHVYKKANRTTTTLKNEIGPGFK